MVPFAVYSAFETFQFHDQDGGSSQDVNNSKFAPKPEENGAKIESFPVFCLESSILDRIHGTSEIRNCLDCLKFWISFFFSGGNSYEKYRTEVDFPTSIKPPGASCRK